MVSTSRESQTIHYRIDDLDIEVLIAARMGLMPIYQEPNTSRPARGLKTYSYLLRGLRVERKRPV